MEDFFKANSPAMRFLTAIFNLIAVNIMFIISSLPVITAGAALTGLIKIVYEILEGEEVFLIRDFTRAYISNFKKATLFWLPYILLWAFLGYDIFLVWNKLEGTSFWMMIPPILILLIISCKNAIAYPVENRAFAADSAADIAALVADSAYKEPVSVSGVNVFTQKISCGYAVLQMLGGFAGKSITEEALFA